MGTIEHQYFWCFSNFFAALKEMIKFILKSFQIHSCYSCKLSGKLRSGLLFLVTLCILDGGRGLFNHKQLVCVCQTRCMSQCSADLHYVELLENRVKAIAGSVPAVADWISGCAWCSGLIDCLGGGALAMRNYFHFSDNGWGWADISGDHTSTDIIGSTELMILHFSRTLCWTGILVWASKSSFGKFVTLDCINKTDLTSLMFVAAVNTDSSLTLADWLNLVAAVACSRNRQLICFKCIYDGNSGKTFDGRWAL